MSKPFQMTIYIDGLTVGSLVLKATGQYYKIAGLLGVLPLTADVHQFIRSVIAGATPYNPFVLEDIKGKAYDFELRFASYTTFVRLWLITADAGKAVVFEWEGKFSEFRDGVKIIK